MPGLGGELSKEAATLLVQGCLHRGIEIRASRLCELEMSTVQFLHGSFQATRLAACMFLKWPGCFVLLGQVEDFVCES